MDINAEFKSETSPVVALDVSNVEEQEQQQPNREQPVLERFINFPSSINFDILIEVPWETFASIFQFSLLNGGPASMVYGAILTGIGASALSLSLAEMASIDPIVGAQYRWSANFAPFAPRFWGLVQGWLTVSAWCFSTASATAILANIIAALVTFNTPSYDPPDWVVAMFMWAFILIPLVANIYFRKILNFFETLGGILHVVVFIVSIITLAVMARHSTTDFVFKTLLTGVSGWTNPGVSFGIGLLSVAYVQGADGVLHMSAEVKRVRTRVPYSIISSTVSNAIMQFAFVICLLFTIGDINAVTTVNPRLPLIEVYYLATNSVAATNIFIIAIFFIFFVTVFNNFASVSRLIWAFARDNGLPFSKVFAKVHPKYRMPLNALGLVITICFLLSLIYIGSTTAFNAILSLAAIGLYVSYIPPVAFILLRKIRGPPITFGPFKLGKWGIPVNLVTLAFLLYIHVWFAFPTILPVTASNMNYAAPILLLVIFGSIADWVISGHKRFDFPVQRYTEQVFAE